MISTLHNNSNLIGVRINNLNNNTSKQEYENAEKIDIHSVGGGSVFTWKTYIDYDYAINSGVSTLVASNRANGNPFGGPLLDGESRVVSYSLNGGKTWTVLQNDPIEYTYIGNTGLGVRATMNNNTSLMNIGFNGNPDLIGNVEIDFKVEMIYANPSEPHVNYKGPEYFVFVLRGRKASEDMNGFVDTENSILFDGHQPYVHWFPGMGQSVGLNYSMTLWYVSGKSSIEVSLENNDIFRLLDATKFTDPANLDTLEKCCAGYEWDGNEWIVSDVATLTLEGQELNGAMVYPIYLCAKADSPGQYTHPITIDGVEYTIGIDAYAENENLYINLSNMGVEIPDSVQKALYTNNVHEEKKDNILLNRKFKELISQYWDTLAGRGSYKSLINSLDWFEWGDGVRLREIWSRANNFGLNLLSDRELSALLKEEYKNTLTTFKKTTYLSIYHSLETPLKVDDEFVYDEQKNPVLDYTRDLWSKEDLSLKLAMLGAFYETFFMPIHLELLHCTIEDVVFTNTFKGIFGAGHSRRDTVYDSCEVECNVKDGDNFYLHNTQTQTNPSTLFGWDWEREHDAYTFGDINWDLTGLEQFTADVVPFEDESNEITKELIKRVRGLYRNVEVIGVEDEATAGDVPDITDNDQLRNFWAQYYKGVGVVVPFELVMTIYHNDTVEEERLVISKYDDKGNLIKTSVRTSHVAVNSVQHDDGSYTITVPFKLLFTEDASWQLRIELTTATGLNTVKIVNINTLDLSNATINICRVRPNLEGVEYETDVTDYMMQRQPFLPLSQDIEEDLPYEPDENFFKQYTYTQFLPYYRYSNKSIKKNRIIVFETADAQGEVDSIKEFLQENDFNVFDRTADVDTRTIFVNYVIGVSKWFDDGREIEIPEEYLPYLYRNDSGFFGQFHHLEPLAEDEANDPLNCFFIEPEEVLCVVPDIKYARDITWSEWEFKNISKNKSYIVKSNDNEHTISAQTPFVAPNKGMLEPGYYDVIFRYKIKSSDDSVRTLRRNSAFKLLKK